MHAMREEIFTAFAQADRNFDDDAIGPLTACRE
jgi:hypothetical protein